MWVKAGYPTSSPWLSRISYSLTNSERRFLLTKCGISLGPQVHQIHMKHIFSGPRPPQSFLTSVFSVSLATRSSVWSSYSSPSPCRRILFQEPLVNSSALWYCQPGHQPLTTAPVELTLSTDVESDASTVHSWYAQGCPVNAQMEDKTKLFVLYFSIYTACQW